MDKRGKVKKSLVREFSAGGAVFRRRVAPIRLAPLAQGKQVEWLIIKPAGTDRWQLPKGHIEEGEKGKEAAIREVFEETGARAKVLDKVGTAAYFYVLRGKRIFKHVAFFLMECGTGLAKVDKAWAHEIDKVCWLSTKVALGKLTFEGERKILEKASKML